MIPQKSLKTFPLFLEFLKLLQKFVQNMKVLGFISEVKVTLQTALFVIGRETYHVEIIQRWREGTCVSFSNPGYDLV